MEAISSLGSVVTKEKKMQRILGASKALRASKLTEVCSLFINTKTKTI